MLMIPVMPPRITPKGKAASLVVLVQRMLANRAVALREVKREADCVVASSTAVS